MSTVRERRLDAEPRVQEQSTGRRHPPGDGGTTVVDSPKAQGVLALAGFLLLVLCLLILWVGVPAQPAGATDIPGIPPGASSVKAPGVGITVSWAPTSSPVNANRGGETRGSFWVTNQSSFVIPVSVEPLTAHPQDNGNLTVTKGTDPIFSSISYSPNSFVAQPRTTTVIEMTIDTPPHLPAGVYLLPAGVTPTLPPSAANLHIRETIVALVTVKASGPIDAHVSPTFLGPVSLRPGATGAHRLPGLPPIQVANSGSEVLRVLDDSKSSFYATYEIAASQTPFGDVVFRGHTPGISNDLRGPPDLYFPRTYRDFPVTWQSTFLGFGTLTAHAYVGFQLSPGELVHVGVSTQAVLVSPLWILTLALLLLILLMASDRVARRQLVNRPVRAKHRTGRRTLVRFVGSAAVVAVVTAAAFLAIPVVFFIVGAAGLGLGLVHARVSGRRDRAVVAAGVRRYEGAALVLVVAATVAVVLSALSLWPGDLAIGILAGSGVWVIVAWWTLWWNDGRGPAETTMAATVDLLPGRFEAVPVGT